MNCREFDQIVDEFLDGGLPDQVSEAARRHAAGCGRCRQRLEAEEALHRDLRSLPVPPMPAGLPERVLARAREQAAPARPRARQAASWALAASLALGIGIGALVIRDSGPRGPEQVVMTTAEDAPRIVTLLYNSETPLTGVTVTLRIPAHVALEGYGDRRELTWQTDLRAGRNVLRLPLVARAEGRGFVETELVRGDKRKTFRVELMVRPPQEFPMGEGLKTAEPNHA